MDFKSHLKSYLDESEIESLVDSFAKEEQKGLLLNTNKMNTSDFKKMFPNVKNHPVIPYAFLYEKNEYNFGTNILHELGAYYIQDPSAMLVSYLLSPKEDEYVLDMCAAPGGKTIGASLLMHNKGLVIANDISRSRLDVLASNIERLGLSNVMITMNDFSKNYHDYPNTFDRIILDAPCSGSGMFRKMSEMKDDWSINKVLKFAEIQKELISIAYFMLKEGGTLVYSTCSYSHEEDEEVIKYLLENSNAKLVKIPHIEGEFRSKDLPEAIHLFSSRFLGEGHFICIIRKEGTLSKNKVEPETYEISSKTKGGVSETICFEMPMKNPLKKDVFVIRKGLHKYTHIKDKIIPSHAYAKSIKDEPNMVEVSLDDAKKYILGESLPLQLKNGYYYPCYMSLPIGVMYSVDGRIKNLYPKGLRKKII